MKIINRKFRRDYEEIEKYEVGIALSGAEVKSVRAGRIRLEDSFVFTFKAREIFSSWGKSTFKV